MLIFSLVAPAVIAAGLEFEHYRRFITAGTLPLLKLDDLVLFGLLWAKSLLVMIPLLGAAGLCAWLDWRKSAWTIFLLGAILVTFWLVVDVQVHALTNLHVLTLAALLKNPDATEVGGGTWAIIGPYVLPFLGVALAVLVLARVAHPVADRLAGWCGRLGPRCGALLATGGFLLPILVALPAQRLFSRPILFQQLEAELPVPLPTMVGNTGGLATDALDAFNHRLQTALAPVYGRLLPGIIACPPPDRTVALGTRRPDVLVIVLESWRHEVLCPQDMPRLSAFAATGLRLTRHYSAGNNSHPGLFSLLYGRYPLTYHQTLDKHVPAQWPLAMRDNGYLTTYLATTLIAWERMEEYLNHTVFDDIVADDKGNWPGRDERTLARIRGIFARPAPQPRFVVAFLLSTHYPYTYPPRYDVHHPAASEEMVQSPRRELYRQEILNRYLNAAAFLDDQIGRTLEGVDLSHTIVVLTGDHGESILDDGFMAHGSRLSDAQTRVPLAIFGCGVPAEVVDRPSSHVDVLPTVAHLIAGRHVPIAHSQGRDLLDPQEPAGPVMIFQLAPTREPSLPGAIIGPQGHLLLRFFTDPAEAHLQVLGPLDARGSLELAASPTADQEQQWNTCATGMLERLAR